jgi:hypothetical protein
MGEAGRLTFGGKITLTLTMSATVSQAYPIIANARK